MGASFEKFIPNDFNPKVDKRHEFDLPWESSLFQLGKKYFPVTKEMLLTIMRTSTQFQIYMRRIFNRAFTNFQQKSQLGSDGNLYF